ncbi:hypothetical protein LOTGIDRAFT_175370 [Lottia gigantea]|uniref:CCHC-type domain-containing protein n=1 Tax=Lottia gigantea TaxID=225164 RepID=V4BZT4_LOTGI|nr:hypothetical protein LOTGIDRAFT_175370 [Lottia gigantea]ESO94674.1 hypothetical protein LOTGIDRAFT_175370 [Lottia gigantea]
MDSKTINQRRTLQLVQSSGNQFIYGHDFVRFLEKNHIDPQRIVSMGSDRSNKIFQVTFDDEGISESFVNRHNTAHIGNNIYTVSGCDRSRLTVRLFWLPEYISDKDKTSFFKSFGLNVNSVQREFHLADGIKHIRTLTRRVLVEGRSSAFDSLPHTSSICGKDVLMILQGRPPICLKCYQAGHMRKECPLSRQSGTLSYAGVASGSRAPPYNTSRQITSVKKLLAKNSSLSPPLPPIHVELFDTRVDKDGFVKPKNTSKKRTLSESNVSLISTEDPRIVQISSEGRKPLNSPPKKKVNHLSKMLAPAAAGANSVELVKSSPTEVSKVAVGCETDVALVDTVTSNVITPDVVLPEFSGDMMVDDFVEKSGDDEGEISESDPEMDHSSTLADIAKLKRELNGGDTSGRFSTMKILVKTPLWRIFLHNFLLYVSRFCLYFSILVIGVSNSTYNDKNKFH